MAEAGNQRPVSGTSSPLDISVHEGIFNSISKSLTMKALSSEQEFHMQVRSALRWLVAGLLHRAATRMPGCQRTADS